MLNSSHSLAHLQTNLQSKRQNKTSLLSTVITNHLTHFNHFMSSQSLMFKSTFDSLHVSYQLPKAPETHMLKPTSQSSSNSSLNSIAPTTQQTNSSHDTTSLSSQTSNTNSLASTSTTAASKPGTTSNFASNLFGLLRKGSLSREAPALTAAQQQLQQQQSQKELQQKRLKQQRTDTKTITQYIKSFEAIVIKSLRQYTFTTSVNLQARILELLVQLIFLKVDYCLLDSDKVFIEYVLKQFDQLEQKRGSDGGMSRSASRMGGNTTYESNSTLDNTFDMTSVDENG